MLKFHRDLWGLRRMDIFMRKKANVRKMAMTAVLSAVAAVLMFFSFNVPLMPGFIKLDLSELPALIAAFSMGPFSGVAVCLVKNLINLPFSSTLGAGELCNFLLGVCFVLPAGLLYRHKGGRKSALAGSLTGAASMALISLPINYFITYPVYSAVYGLTTETILNLYRVINPGTENLWQALLLFNLPFTFIKGLLSVLITFLIYKKISPLIKGHTM